MAFYALDLETTGLGLDTGPKDFILELGLGVYDNDLELVDAKSWLVGDYETYRRFIEVDEEPNSFVGNMHRSNGLYEDWMRAYRLSTLSTPFDAAFEADQWLYGHGFPSDRSEPMVGSSIHFDRERFLRFQMPNINDMFHYRNIDASAQRAYIEKRKPKFAANCAKILENSKRGNHRVLDDIHDSINLLRVLDGLEPRL